MRPLLERIGVALPIVQAGMGGGTASHELAGAVSEAGGLGTIGFLDPGRLKDEIRRAKASTARPIAVNLLLPFARPGHWEAAAEADVVVTFWGAPVRRTGKTWIHQCGSVDEASAACAAGVDAVIAQGVEAGGHVRGTEPALELVERVRRALPPDYPVLAAGGICAAADVKAAFEAGAEGVVCGTRFLLSEESRAHPAYKQRLLDADETLLTELFGTGWPRAPHRVIPNAATERWLRRDRRGPTAVRATNAAMAPLLARLPVSAVARLAAIQRPGLPLFGPASPVEGHSESSVDSAPLYAGECVARIADVRPAADLTRDLAG